MCLVSTEQGRVPFKFTANAITREERERLVAQAAYFRAQHRNFKGCDVKQDWQEAEQEVDKMFHVAY